MLAERVRKMASGFFPQMAIAIPSPEIYLASVLEHVKGAIRRHALTSHIILKESGYGFGTPSDCAKIFRLPP